MIHMNPPGCLLLVARLTDRAEVALVGEVRG